MIIPSTHFKFIFLSVVMSVFTITKVNIVIDKYGEKRQCHTHYVNFGPSFSEIAKDSSFVYTP